MPKEPSPASFVGSLRSLCDAILRGAEDRITLFSLELEQEKVRFVWTIVWIGGLAFTGFLSVAFASLGMVYLFWESARTEVLMGLAGFYFATFSTIGVLFMRHLARQPQPFRATLEEFDTDRSCLGSKE
jgi:uncharacterized membrane protein YqjE